MDRKEKAVGSRERVGLGGARAAGRPRYLARGQVLGSMRDQKREGGADHGRRDVLAATGLRAGVERPQHSHGTESPA